MTTSLKTNVVANYVGQVYLALIGVVMLPVYVRYMGAEAYGLVGFFTTLQAWFLLLDLGLTPTLGRELSRCQAGALDRAQGAAMVRALEWLFGTLGAVCTLAVGLSAGWIARHWLKAEHLPEDEVRRSLLCMGAMIGLRGWTGIYRGGLAGLERMVALNGAAMALATLRSVGVLGVLLFWTTRPSAFFAYQLGVAAVELGVMAVIFYRAFPMHGAGAGPHWRSLSGTLGLSGGMAFLAGIWVVFSQTDRLVLSWILPLQDYGYFVVAATLAGGISLLATPVSQALQPRFAILAAQHRDAELVALYRMSTQATCAIVFAVAGVMICFAEPLTLAWTGNTTVAREAARIVPLYAFGNAVMPLLGLAFLVQFAYGQIRWQVVGNCLFGAIWIPGAYLAATRAGAVGTGWVWMIGNLAFLVLWLPYVHHRLLPGLAAKWLFNDVGMVLVTVALGALVASRLSLTGTDRWATFAVVGIIAVLLAAAGLCTGSETRRLLLERYRRSVLVKAS